MDQEMVDEQVVKPKGIEQGLGEALIEPEGTGVGVGVGGIGVFVGGGGGGGVGVHAPKHDAQPLHKALQDVQAY